MPSRSALPKTAAVLKLIARLGTGASDANADEISANADSEEETGDPAGHQFVCDEALLGKAGAEYRGCQTKTRSGLECQAWGAQTPHAHDRTRSHSANGY